MRLTHLFAGLILLAALLAAAPCAAQSTSLPREIVSAKAALKPEQKAILDEYATRKTNVFATGEPTEVVAVRNELIDQFRNPSLSEICRRDLAIALVKGFEPLTKSGATFRPINAFLVAQFMRTPDAVDFLVDNINADQQPDAGLRASAASQLPKACMASGLSNPLLEATAKRISAAAASETNWRAIAAETECIGEMMAMKLPKETAIVVAGAQAAIINSVTERTLKGGPKDQDLVSALQRGLLVVRNQLTNTDVSGDGRGTLLKGISPSLAQIKEMKDEKASEFSSSPQRAEAFKNAVNTAQLLQEWVSHRGS